MKLKFLILFTSLLVSFCLNAETISTELFTIETPNHWIVEDDKLSAIAVTGKKIVDATPLPFLLIQYCKNSKASSPNGPRHCDATCSKKSLESSFRNSNKDMQFSSIVYNVKPSGAIEYSAEATIPKNGSAFATLSCTTHAQVYVSMLSDEEKTIAKPVFERIMSSLKWK